MSPRDKASSVEPRERMGIELETEVVKRNRLRWLSNLCYGKMMVTGRREGYCMR